MPTLIDGHNLIPKLGLRLDSLDDETELMTRLQEYCRLRRTQVEVYFDGALPGTQPTRKTGAVTAHFVRRGTPADAAIETRLARLGRQAGNWKVVSSDRRVQVAARAVHASVLSSEEFAREMSDAARQAPAGREIPSLSPQEVEQWEKEFKNRKG
jgi:predicted RNA-binding protein with PIN domain